MNASDLSRIDPNEPILSCDGQGIKRLIHAGLMWLDQTHEIVNSLNVFPVPDGDTGTNMLLTMQSAYREIADHPETHVGRMFDKLYNGALMGARGNSGVILSQLLRGFARGVHDSQTLSVPGMVMGFDEASKMAYKAVQSPVEGTILTVSRDAARRAAEAAEKTQDMREVLRAVVQECNESVERTPSLLPVLMEAGVVDSGGKGMTYIFEGMLRLLDGLSVGEGAAAIAHGSGNAGPPDYDPDYPYDVQFLIKGESLRVDDIRADIESMGDSGVIVGDTQLVKVHIHVKNPGVPLGYGAGLGSIDDVVVENMYEQYLAFIQKHADPSVRDFSDMTPPTINEGDIATVVIAPGRGFRNIFYSLGAGVVIEGGQTMNPSTGDILEAINRLPTDKVFILPNNKNVFMAAEQAAEKADGKQVGVVPSKTIPQGISSQLMLMATGEFEDVFADMTGACDMVQTGEITTSVRDVSLNGLGVKKGQIIGLHNDVMCVAGENIADVLMDLLEAMDTDEYELITVYYGEEVTPEEARDMLAIIKVRYPDHEIELRAGEQPHYFYVIGVE